MSNATDTSAPERPSQLTAVPVRHRGRWVGMAVLAVIVTMFVHMLVTNDAFEWSFMWHNMFRPPVLRGARTTLELTVLAMLIGVAFGIVLAVMRLSPNPVIRGTAWAYTWFFRAVPRLVLCILFGNLGILFQKTSRINFGVPLGNLLGLPHGGRIFDTDANTLLAGFSAGLLALAMSEAAYMAEIVRAGILAVDAGQNEAAQALGMSRMLTMRRIVLPQAMRVILPPTGNETIAMLKDTSLVAFVPAYELFFQLEAVGSRTFKVFPMLVAATLWYLAMTSVLLVGQHFLEKRFSRGVAGRTGKTRKPKPPVPAGGMGGM
ncbi:MAG: amino acid ABC transporter permease [Actinomycetota bacterium]